MISECPRCGSQDIIPDLICFGNQELSIRATMVLMENPERRGKDYVGGGLRADVCGACGHVEIYTPGFEDLLEAHRKGYVTKNPR